LPDTQAEHPNATDDDARTVGSEVNGVEGTTDPRLYELQDCPQADD